MVPKHGVFKVYH